MNTTDVSSRGGGAGQRRCKQQPITCLGDDSLLLLSAHVRRPEHLLPGPEWAGLTRVNFSFFLESRLFLIKISKKKKKISDSVAFRRVRTAICHVLNGF